MQQEKAASASTRVRDGMTRFLGGITKVLTIPPDEQDDRAEVISGSVMYDRNKVTRVLFLCQQNVTQSIISMQ